MWVCKPNQVCTWENKLLSKGSEKHEACMSEEKCSWNRLSKGQGQAFLEVQCEGLDFPSGQHLEGWRRGMIE